MPTYHLRTRVRDLVWQLETLGCPKSRKHLCFLRTLVGVAEKFHRECKNRAGDVMSQEEEKAYARLEEESRESKKKLSLWIHRVQAFINRRFRYALASMESPISEAIGDTVHEGPLSTASPFLTANEVASYFNLYCQ